ncbi:MAG: YdcF family protein [Candidatus Sumerlaeaceae bacterium]|nr:YdcF family protein [Candidatus Sumerlaeaceae bacterium]
MQVVAFLLLLGCGALVGLVAIANLIILRTTRGRIISSVSEIPGASWAVAIVLGARVWPSGRPSLILEDRLQAALELYKGGRVEKVFVSGDDSPRSHREVTVMAKWLSDRGVPSSDMILDPVGRRTFLTMLNARRAGIRNAIVVTQGFHLPRALWLARSQGIVAIGVRADRRRYQTRVYARVWAREIGARVLAFIEAVVSQGE